MVEPTEKTALVTGASRGIGAAIAKYLALAGHNIAITYSSSQEQAENVVKELEKNGIKAKAYKADANAPETMAQLAQNVLSDFGTIDILVNNAGVFAMGNIGEIDYSDYQRAMRINVDSVLALTNEVAKNMPEGGRIINMGSVLGERASAPGLSIYNASKAAVAMFARSWAKDLGERGILVTSVQPGPIDTEMNPADGDAAEYMRSQTVLGRHGKVDEIAATVAFLASPGAAYITGTTITVDGGWNA